jgi:hypothetical protein
MRTILLSIFLTGLALMAQAQSEIVLDSVSVEWIAYTDTTGAFLVKQEQRFADGSFTATGQVIGDTTNTRAYLVNQVINSQLQEADAIRSVANSVERNQMVNQYSALLEQIGVGTYANAMADLYFASLQGRYRVAVAGQASFVATLIRVPNGGVRLEREDDQTRYTVLIFSPRSFVVRSLPGATGDQKVALWRNTTRGLPIYSTPTRNVRLTLLLDSELQGMRSGR